MSILIKGMEMPKDIEPGLVIEFADGIDGKRYARLYHYRHGGLTEWIEAIPAADVRPVVMCRDCKWWRGEGTICKGIGIDFDADGFCCEGERKDGADMREES